jgi:putative endonuclease
MEQKQWFLYMLKLKNGSIYTGITTDVERRLREHRETKRGSKYVRSHLPFTLAMTTPAGKSRSLAQSFERAVKKFSKKQKQDLIRIYNEHRREADTVAARVQKHEEAR